MTTQLQRGVDAGKLIGGLTTAGIGAGGIVATAIGMRFAYRNLALPEWLVYALAAVLLLMGGYTISQAMKALKCSCGKVLEEGRVIFPADGGREPKIVQGVKDGQIAPLASLRGGSDDFSLKLAYQFCASCSQVANLTLLKNDSEKLIQNRLLTGPAAAEAISFLHQHGKVED